MSQILERLAESEPANLIPWLKLAEDGLQKQLAQMQWPSRKTEDWKYTSLNAVEAGDYLFSGPPVTQEIDRASLKLRFEIQGLPTSCLVFVNGVFDTELSNLDDLPVGLDVVNFSDADEAQAQVIQKNLDRLVDCDKHLFGAINKHLLSNGVLVYARKNVTSRKPIQIVWLTTVAEKAFQVPQRMLAVLEDNADITVIEQFVSASGEQNCLTHGITELNLGDGAQMHHYRLHQESHGSLHIGGVHASLGRNAYLNSFHMALGSKLKRIDVVINQDGEGARCVLNGVYLPQQDQHVDYHTCIEHRIPLCTTSENFRGIVGGNGRAVFNGRIHIHRNAQKTIAELSNKNLLTSTKAEVDSKPELEIYADDVQCAHGTTIAQLDEKALYYFQTRGISAKKAEVMLSYGFIKELIDGVHHAELVDYLTPLLAEFFAKDPNLAGVE